MSDRHAPTPRMRAAAPAGHLRRFVTEISLPQLIAIGALAVTLASSAHAGGATLGSVNLGFRQNGGEIGSVHRRDFREGFIPAGNKRFCTNAVKSIFTTRCSLSGARQQRMTAYNYTAPSTWKSSAILGTPISFVQTLWFLVLCWLLAHTSAFPFYRRITNAAKDRTDARLQERQRIARELHDTLMQSTQGLILSFQAIADELPKSAAMRTKMEAALDQAENLLCEARNHVSDLRIICVDGNVTRALSRTAHDFMMTGSVGLRVISNGACRAIVEDVADDIYRIGREALTNAFVHADAETIVLQTTYTLTGFTLRIQDDGQGIDPKIMTLGSRPHHFGLEGMRERATRIGARLHISSHPGMGTAIELCVPACTAYRDPGGMSPVLRAASLLRPTGIQAANSHVDGRLARVR
jgi:hypothetical protein